MKEFFVYATIIALLHVVFPAAAEEDKPMDKNIVSREDFEHEQKKAWQEFRDQQLQDREAFKAELRKKREQWHQDYFSAPPTYHDAEGRSKPSQ